MKITVYTNQPSRLITDVVSHMRRRGDSAQEWQRLHYMSVGNRSAIEVCHGESITFKQLSPVQFCAVEDVAVRQGLQYDGSQGDDTEEDRLHRQEQAHLEAAARWNDEHGPFS